MSILIRAYTKEEDKINIGKDYSSFYLIFNDALLNDHYMIYSQDIDGSSKFSDPILIEDDYTLVEDGFEMKCRLNTGNMDACIPITELHEGMEFISFAEFARRKKATDRENGRILCFTLKDGIIPKMSEESRIAMLKYRPKILE